jgi:hypothetical protein
VVEVSVKVVDDSEVVVLVTDTVLDVPVAEVEVFVTDV